jgi:BolA protein
MGMKDSIIDRLTAGLAPTRLAVVDESDRHIGHARWREHGETHFRVEIVSAAFAGRSRVASSQSTPAAAEFARGCTPCRAGQRPGR